jgi:hypothetical protein
MKEKLLRILWNNTVLGVLFVPMNVLSRISCREIWETGDFPAKVFVGIAVAVIWGFMYYCVDSVRNERKEKD